MKQNLLGGKSMAIVRFNPLYEINSLHRQMNRLLDEITAWDDTRNSFLKPAVELLDNNDSLMLKVLVPGIDKKDLDVSVTRDSVKVSGEYHRQEENKDPGYYISEFNYGKFERTINLPLPIKNDQVKAEYNDGVLTLILPKLEDEKNKVFKVSLGAEEKPALESESNG